MNSDNALWETAERLASRDYDIETFRDTLPNGETVILAKNPELPGCMAHGATRTEAIEDLKDARIEYIYSLLEDNLPVPHPRNSATSTNVNTQHVSLDSKIIVGFGTAAVRVIEPNSREREITIAYRGSPAD